MTPLPCSLTGLKGPFPCFAQGKQAGKARSNLARRDGARAPTKTARPAPADAGTRLSHRTPERTMIHPMTDYYCSEHEYNPPLNSGLAFCPRCEFPEAFEDNDITTPETTLRDPTATNNDGRRPASAETTLLTSPPLFAAMDV